MSLPQVGAVAKLVGAAAFKSAANDVTSAIDGITKKTTALEKASNQSWAIVGSTAAIGLGAITAAASAAVTAMTLVASATGKMAADFDQNMVGIQAISGATQEDMVALGEKMLDIGRNTVIGANMATEGITELYKGGVQINDILSGAAQAVMDFQIASKGELDLGKAAMVTAGGLTAFSLSGKEATRVTNSLTAASMKSAISINDVVRSFQQSSAVMAAANMSIEENAAAIAVLGLGYLRGSDAGTSLKQMFIALEKPTKKALELMKKYGISLFNADGTTRDMRTVIADLNKSFGDEAIATGKITEMQRNYALATIFGSDAVRAATVFAQKGTKAYDEMYAATQQINTADIAKKMQNTPNAQWKILTNNIEAAAIIIGTQLVPGMTTFLKIINNGLRNINPEVFVVFGQALSSLVTGRGFENLYTQLAKLIGVDLARTLYSWINLLKTIRDAITGYLLPAFQYLFRAIFDGSTGTSIAADAFNILGSAIITVSKYLAYFIGIVSNVITWLRTTEAGANALKIAFDLLMYQVALTGVAMVSSFVAAVMKAITPTLLLTSAIAKGLVSALSMLVWALASVVRILFTSITAIGKFVMSLVALGAATLRIVYYNTAMAVSYLRTLIPALVTTIANFLVYNTILVAKLIPSMIATIAKTVLMSGAFLALAAKGIVAAIVGIAAFVANLLIWNDAVAVAIARIGLFGVVSQLAGVRVLGLAVGMKAAQLATFLLDGGLKRMIVTIYATIAGFNLLKLQSLAASIASAGLWTTLKTAAVSALTAIMGSLVPFLIGLAAIIAVAALIYLAWTNDWGGIREFTAKVLDFLSTKIGEFLDWLNGLPIIGGFVGELRKGFSAAKDEVIAFAQDPQKEIKKLDGMIGGIGTTLTKAMGLGEEATNSLNERMGVLINTTNYLDNEVRTLAQDYDDLLNSQMYGPKMPKEEGPPQGPGFPDIGDDKESESDRIKRLTAQIQKMLAVLPTANKELAEFMARIVDESPDRLQPMVDALIKSKSILDEMVLLKRQILATDIAIAQAEQNIANISRAIQSIDLASQQQNFALNTQILQLRGQQLQVERDMLPVRSAIAAIDRQIAQLQRENLDLKRQQLEIEMAALPYKYQVAQLDAKIAQLNRVDYNTEKARLALELQAIPLRQKVAAIEQQITDVVDQRLKLTTRAQELQAQNEVANIEDQLAMVENDLTDAWASMDIDRIIALEAQKEALKGELTPAQQRLDAIQREQAATERKDELIQIGLELEKLAIEESLKPLEKKLQAIANETELKEAQAAITKAALEAEKQALTDIITKYDEQAAAVQYAQQMETLRNQLVILNLESERRAYEDQLLVLEDRRLALQDQVDAIQNQIDINVNLADQMKRQYEQLKLDEEIRQNELETTRAKQTATYKELIQHYIDAITQSGAFSAAEGIETLKRMKMWDDQAGKLAEVNIEFDEMDRLAKSIKDTVDAIPPQKVIDIYINVHGSVPSFASGGVVPGAYGQPSLAIVHGGERFLGVRGVSPTASMRGASVSNVSNITNNHNYNVNANYANTQSQASVAMDMSALVTMTRR